MGQGSSSVNLRWVLYALIVGRKSGRVVAPYPKTIIVRGHHAEGVTLIQNGWAQTFNCPNPQPYTAVMNCMRRDYIFTGYSQALRSTHVDS